MQPPDMIQSGTRREIGFAQGARIRSLRLPPIGDADRSFGAQCRRSVERWHLPMIEEYEGMLSASWLPEDAFESYYFGRTAPYAGGCTNIAVTGESTVSGTSLVGRNYDWAYADKRWCETRVIAPIGEPRRVGYTHHWGGLCDAMNEHGVTICIASLPPTGRTAPGLQWHIVVDLVMTRSTSVAEAVDLLVGIPHVRSLSYLVVDATDARLVEAGPDGSTVNSPEHGLLVGTNHRIGNGSIDDPRRDTSRKRRERARELLVGKIDRSDMVRVLSDHTGGICAGDYDFEQHVHTTSGQSGTIWSMIASPADRLFEIAPGHPCSTPFNGIRWIGYGEQ